MWSNVRKVADDFGQIHDKLDEIEGGIFAPTVASYLWVTRELVNFRVIPRIMGEVVSTR